LKKFQKNLPQRQRIQKTWEMVRLKAYDPYFTKTKKFFILPHSPWIYSRIEEG